MAYEIHITGIENLRGEIGYLPEEFEVEKYPDADLVRSFLKMSLLKVTKIPGGAIHPLAKLNFERHPSQAGIWQRYETAEALYELWVNLGFGNEQLIRDHLDMIRQWDLKTPIIDRGSPQIR